MEFGQCEFGAVMRSISGGSRREFMNDAATASLGAAASQPAAAHALAQDRPADDAREPRGRALIAITLDLEMSRNFPAWESTHWDYEKGNLNEETKRYTVEACRRIRGHGGRAHL